MEERRGPGGLSESQKAAADGDAHDSALAAERVMAADIVIIGTPIWLGEKASVCTRFIERLYGNSAQLNQSGQYAYVGCHGLGCRRASAVGIAPARW